MRIGDLAAATGVSRRLLRYYEEQGLLRPRRLPNGYREYSALDVIAVRHIRRLLAAGLPTAVIVRFLHCVRDEMPVASCPRMVTDLLRERERIAGEISRLETSRHLLDAMLDDAG